MRYTFLLLSALSAFAKEDGDGTQGPVILEHPLDTIIPKGEPVTLNCKATGAEPMEILWVKDGEVISTAREEASSHRVLLPAGSLFFLRVHSGAKPGQADSGVYHCLARNPFGEARSRNASLRIAMLRDEFRLRPRNEQAVVGQQAVLECSPPRGFPEPVVTWKKDGRDIRPEDDPRLTIHSSGNIIISDVGQADSGFYTCVARNMVGVKESPPARLSVYEKPRFLKRPDDVTAEVGGDVVFGCRVEGDPMPVIVWRKAEGKMPLGRAQILESKGLRIDRVLPSDEGEYICTGKNPAGTIEASARLLVHAAPEFSDQPQDLETEEGSTASFACSATGNPPPAIFWVKEGQQNLMFPGFSSPDNRIQVDTEGRLVVGGVSAEDAGFYVCSALNAAGSNVLKVHLKVPGKSLLREPPPIIIQGAGNQSLSTGTLAILPCKAIGHTQPAISWTKDALPLDGSVESLERVEQLGSGALRISNLAPADSGLYTCTATNKDGHSSWSASLQVKDASDPDAIFRRMPEPGTYPSAPSKPTAITVGVDWVELGWTAPNRAGASAITGYLLQYYSPEEGQTWISVPAHVRETRYRLANLRPGSSYIFLVRAENREGVGEPSAMSAVVRTKGPAASEADDFDLELARKRLGSELLLKLVEIKRVNASAVKLFWRPKRQEPLVEGFLVRWRGPPQPDNRLPFLNLTDPTLRSALVSGLSPYTQYTFFVVPYYRSVEGLPSNTLDITTDEAIPSLEPTDVGVRMMNLTTLRISWRPPPDEGLNGLLRGYNILVKGNCSGCLRNISTNERAASVTLFHLKPGVEYAVHVAAATAAGIGKYHHAPALRMDADTLQRHLRLHSSHDTSAKLREIAQSPWFIATVGVVLWLLLGLLVGGIWWWKKRGPKKSPHYLSTPFIKINDGSVVTTARDALWMDHSAFSTGQRGSNGVIPQASQSIFNDLRINTDGSANYYADQKTRSPPPAYDMTANPMANPELIRATLARHHNLHYEPHLDQFGRATSQQNLSTFYHQVGGELEEESPTPYATTTLVMGRHRQHLINEALRRAGGPPTLPHSGPPSGPPPGLQPYTSRSENQNGSSPPNTDISYVHSSDGTGGSSGTTSGRQTTRSRLPPGSQPALLDFLPPPPDGPPPNDPYFAVDPTAIPQPSSARSSTRPRPAPRVSSQGPKSVPTKRRKGVRSNHAAPYPPPGEEDYDYETLHDMLRSFHSSDALPQQPRVPGPGVHHQRFAQQPSPRPQTSPYPQQPYPDPQQPYPEPSPESSIVDEDEPSEAETDEDVNSVGAYNGYSAREEFTAALSARANGQSPHEEPLYSARPSQPCMGINASALTASAYEGDVLKGSGNSRPHLVSPNPRLASLPRGRRDQV